MFFASNKSKFQQQSRLVHYLKITSFLLIIITPFALLQFALLSSSYKKFDHDKHIQIIDRKLVNQSRSSPSNHDRVVETAYKHIYARKLDQVEPTNSNLVIQGRVKELFDVNRFLYNPDGESKPFNKSVLRIRRQSSFEGLTTRPPQTIIDNFINHQPEAHDGNLELLRALERSAEEQAIKNGLPLDGHAVATEQNSASVSPGMESGKLQRRTMVLVSSKSGEFNKLLPLDELIVSPAPEMQLSDPSVTNHLATSESGQVQEPESAELTAAGTAAGLFLSGLAAQSPFPEAPYPNDGRSNGGEGAFEEEGELNERPMMKDLSSLHSYNEGQSAIPFQPKESNQQPEEMPERMPDSMESLMSSEGEPTEDLDEHESDSNEPTQFVPNEPQEINGENFQPIIQQSQPALDGRGDTDSEDAHQQAFENHQRRQRLSLTPSSNTLPQEYPSNANSPNTYPEDLAQLYSQSTPDGIIHKPDSHYLMAPMRDSYADLNAAAGHYYGKKKKKKKKVVVKKKKKVS